MQPATVKCAGDAQTGFTTGKKTNISWQYCALEEDGIDSRCDFFKNENNSRFQGNDCKIEFTKYNLQTHLRWTIKEEV